MIGYGVIGGGTRADALLIHMMTHSDEVCFKGMFDPDQGRSELCKSKYGSDQTVCYSNYEDLIAEPEIQWVMVLSPNYCHREQIISAFEAGKHVFAEKPLATTIEDCVAINEAHKKHEDLLFGTGFVLRYAPMYVKVRELLDSGIIGKIISVEANENIPPEHGGHIMTCWRRHKRLSGSHMLEKCCHDIDLLNWFIGDLPSKVASFGGTNIFVPENAENLTKFKAPPGKDSIYLWWDTASRDTQDPFNSEKDVVDNQVAIIEYRNQVRVSFRATSNNAIPERRLFFAGTEGNLISELYSGKVTVKRIGYDEQAQVYEFDKGVGVHGGGDEIIAGQLVDSMVNNVKPVCSCEEGLLSAVVSLSVEKARVEGAIIDLEPIWATLGR